MIILYYILVNFNKLALLICDFLSYPDLSHLSSSKKLLNPLIQTLLLEKIKSKYQNFMFLPTGEFAIHYVILNSALSTRIIFFKTAQCRKADFLIQSKSIPSTDIFASIVLRYSFWLNEECTIWERNVSNASIWE